MLSNALVAVAQGVWFCAPDQEARTFVEPSRLRCIRADAEMDAGHAGDRSCVAEGSLQKLAANAKAAMTGRNVHAPQVQLVRRLEVPVADETHRATESGLKRAQDDRLWAASQEITYCVRRGREVVGRRRGERQRRLEQSALPELDVSLDVAILKLSDHDGDRRPPNAGVQRPGCPALRETGALQIEHSQGEPGSSRVRCNALLGGGSCLAFTDGMRSDGVQP